MKKTEYMPWNVKGEIRYEEKQKDSLRYDLEYQKKTIWKFQLVCLIILFFIANTAACVLSETPIFLNMLDT